MTETITATKPIIRLVGVTKSFGPVSVLKGVDLEVHPGRVTALVGDNGAGKSTLIKVLSGAVPITSGTIHLRGKPVEIRSTTDAIACGIETIYQDSSLVPQLSIARNLFLGREPTKGPFGTLDLAAMNAAANGLLRRVGIEKDIPPDTPITSLSGGERQAVAIARAMHFANDLIILDEPTNNLGVAETQGVLNFVRSARASGHSCIFIAHNIHHVFQVVDRIVVMRRGRKVADGIDPKQTTVEAVEQIITGMTAEGRPA